MDNERIKEQIIWDRIKQMYNDMDDAAKSQVERVFPELKESEDEKIKTDIQYAVRCAYGDKSSQTDKILTWLEKRGGKKHVIVQKFRIGDLIKDKICDKTYKVTEFIDNGIAYTDENGERFTKYYDEYDWDSYELVEQKPVECKEKKYSKCYVYNLFHSEAFCKECEFNPNKQKPVEWGEEDENHRKDAILAIQEYRADCIKKYGKDPAWADCVDWLKSLKDRVLPQPKQEWSEEDEKKIKDIIYLLKQLKQHDKKDVYPQELINFLKSLRPQKQEQWNEQDIEMIDWLIRCCEKEYEELCNDRYGHQEIVSDLKRDCRKKWDWLESLKSKVVPQKQWKPSKDEMDALAEALSLANNCGEESAFDLRTLYEELKKQKAL